MTVAVDLGLGNPLTQVRRFIAGMPYRAPIGSGVGYLSGEFPSGITTVEGVPVSATVRILYRPAAGALGDGVVVAQVQSEANGSWQVTGLNPDLRYDVVGRLEGRNDVIMANIKPMRTDMITYDDEYLQPNEDFKGMEGCILLLDGLPPFTVSGTQSMPAGLFTVMDGRKLLIDGTTSEGGEWEAEITVQDANSNTVNIPVVIPIGFDAPSDVATSYSAPNNEVTLTWERNSYVEEGFYIYRSDTEMDMNNLPEPIASVGKGVTQFIDDDVSAGSSYYYVVAAFYQDRTELSGQVVIHLVNRPTVADVATTFIGSNVTTHPVNLPSVDVGDLMVMLFAYDGPDGVQMPDGWTLLGGVRQTSASAAVFYKVVDAEDGSSATVTTIRGERSSAIVYRYIKDSFGEQLEMSPPEIGDSANPAAPSFAQVSSYPSSAIAFYSQDSRTPSGPVFPYPDWRAVPTTGGSNTNVASCAACITDVEMGDVPEFEYQIDTSRQWIAFSVVVPPK